LSSYAVVLEKGAQFDLFDPTDIVGTTFDGAINSAFVDFDPVSWAELDAFDDETAVGKFGSSIGRHA
jgi:hypothetical protein